MYNVIICGLGAVGLTYAVQLKNNKDIDLRILVDENRMAKFSKSKPVFNGVEQDFRYILPSDTFFQADLIIISTKAQGLDSAISYVKNFIKPQTRIMSLLNGISSEEIIGTHYPNIKILKSYFIGHSAMREGNTVIQDGSGVIVTEKDEISNKIFDIAGINYSVPQNIDYSMWLKFTLNVVANQISAILGMTFGEMQTNQEFVNLAKKLIREVKSVAEKKGINNLENLEEDTIKAIKGMICGGKTSMLQDILAKRKTEVDIFAGEIIRLGKLYNIPTPYNNALYDLIKIKEEENSKIV